MLRRFRILFWRNRWLQAGALTAGWWVLDRLAQALRLPVPGGLLAMAVLLALLLGGGVGPHLVRRGAGTLLDHMMLFFVPAVMALLQRPELLGMLGLKLALVIVVSTLAVMAGTALVVEFCFARMGDA
jgi:holin-like protein